MWVLNRVVIEVRLTAGLCTCCMRGEFDPERRVANVQEMTNISEMNKHSNNQGNIPESCSLIVVTQKPW
jgi:hypothetical protein